MDHILKARGPWDDREDNTCGAPATFVNTPTEPIVGSTDFYHFTIIFSTVNAAIAIVGVAWLYYQHATHLSKLSEQLHILRICYFLPVYAVLELIQVGENNAFIYIQPFLKALEAWVLVYYLFLVCHFVAPEGASQRELFLAPLLTLARKHGVRPTDKNPRWRTPHSKLYHARWICAMQAPFVQLFVALVTVLTQATGTYCLTSNKANFSHIYLMAIQILSIAMSVGAIVVIIKSIYAELRPYGATSKLLAFKLLVGLQIMQQIILRILESKNPSPLAGISTLNDADVLVGIPLISITGQLAIFTGFYIYAYPIKPYVIDASSSLSPSSAEEGSATAAAASGRRQYHKFTLALFIETLNFKDLWSAVKFAPHLHRELEALMREQEAEKSGNAAMRTEAVEDKSGKKDGGAPQAVVTTEPIDIEETSSMSGTSHDGSSTAKK